MALSRRRAGLIGAVLLVLSADRSLGQELRSRAQLELAARAGQAEAAYELGLDCDLGASGPEDTAAALHWYRLAADAGLPSAEFNVAVMLDAGRGTVRDAAGAALWYARAATHGHQRAAYDLGLLYEAGDGVPRNVAVAEAWYRAAGTLPAAARKLTSLKSAASPAAGPLVAPSVVNPAPHDAVRRPPPGDIELVWTAPAQSAVPRFYYELVATGSDATRPLAAGFVDTTAALVRLQVGVTAYAWRVSAVDAAAGRYAVSEWARFSLQPAAAGG